MKKLNLIPCIALATLKVKVPNGFDNTNCEVYLIYDGEQTALASLDIYTSDGFFSEHYGQNPIGLNVHFIAVTMIEGQLNYAIHAATITDNYIEYINSFTPISQSDLATLINNFALKNLNNNTETSSSLGVFCFRDIRKISLNNNHTHKKPYL